MRFFALVVVAVLVTTGQALLLPGAPFSQTGLFTPGPGNCNGRYCLSNEASCSNNNCKCSNGKNGDGSLSCLPDSFYRCKLENDPIVKNFKNESFRLPCPCRTLLTSYRNFYPDSLGSSGANGFQCNTNVYSVGERDQGKVFVSGFEVIGMLKKPSQNTETPFRFRGFGQMVKDSFGNYRQKYNALVPLANGSWVPYLDAPNPGGAFSVSIDQANFRMRFQVPNCGLDIIFRPPNPNQGRQQSRVPGLVVGVNSDQNVVGTLQFSNNPTVCASPDGNGLETYCQQLGVNKLEQAAIRLSMTSANQNFPYLADDCKDTATEMDNCVANNQPGSVNALERCSFLLEHEHLVKCMTVTSGGTSSQCKGNAMVRAFKTCVQSICEGNSTMCQDFRTDLLRRCPGRANGWPLTPTFCSNLEPVQIAS